MSSTQRHPPPLPRRDFIKFLGATATAASVGQRTEFERSVAYLRRLGAGMQRT